MFQRCFYKGIVTIGLLALTLINSKGIKCLCWEIDITPTENILALLRGIVILMSFLSSFLGFKRENSLINSRIVAVILICIISFTSSNKFYFFLLFEISMIPIFIRILKIRKESSKIYSAIIMLLINMAMAIPCIIYIFKEFYLISSFNLYVRTIISSKNLMFLLGLIIILIMLSKAPIFFVHVWLPKAHVDAFTLGSVVLARLMIKLRVMGLIKLDVLMEEKLASFSFILYSISWTTLIISLMMIIRRVDIKKLAATSSIVHMGSALNSVLSIKFIGLVGSTIVLFSHGLVSAIIFSIVGLIYEYSEGRSSHSNKRRERLNKVISMIWVLILFLNVGIPPTIRFFREIFLMSTFLFIQKTRIIFLAISMILIRNASMMRIVKVIFYKKERSTTALKRGSCMFLNVIASFTIINLIIMKIF